MASAAQRRKKRIDRKAKSQRADRVLPTEVMGLLSMPLEGKAPNAGAMPSENIIQAPSGPKRTVRALSCNLDCPALELALSFLDTNSRPMCL